MKDYKLLLILMENKGKVGRLTINTVTVYTKYGYAMVDLDKYREELQGPSQVNGVAGSNGSSPDKIQALSKEESVESQNDGSSNMTSEAQKAGDKFIEVQFKFGGYGYLQVSIYLH